MSALLPRVLAALLVVAATTPWRGVSTVAAIFYRKMSTFKLGWQL